MLKTSGIKKILSSHQLGRRNLSPIQRISVTEKYRPIYEKQAKENLRLAEGGDRRSKEYIRNQGVEKLPQVENKIDVRAKLAKTAGVSTDTYSKGKKILDSDNERLKKEVLSGEIGGSAKKVGKRIKELVYGIQHEGDHGNQYTEAKPNNSDLPKSQSDLAAQMGISVDTLQNYKLLAEMIPELSDLVDTGIVTKTTALAIISLLDNNRNS